MSLGKHSLAELLGETIHVPLWNGTTKMFINLDNAATTPSFKKVWDTLAEIMPYYGSIRRGAGYKSIYSTNLFENSISSIFEFSDSSPISDILITGWNTTSCINLLERRLGFTEDSIVVVSEIEHTSNSLPWRRQARVIKCSSDFSGTINLNHLEEILRCNKVALVAVTAASNVTGVLTDIHSIARLSHQYGAEIFVDASQLVAHRKIIRKHIDSIEHIDYIAYSGHKMHAPFGVGILLGNKRIFEKGWPSTAGGGSVKLLDGDEILWSEVQERESGGTPNFVGIVAIAEAGKILNEISFDKIRQHELILTNHFKTSIGNLSELINYRFFDGNDSLAIFPFNINGYNHALVAAILSAEYGIGVRSGHLCQFALIRSFLKAKQNEQEYLKMKAVNHDTLNTNGIVRASCGLGTVISDIDELTFSLNSLILNGPAAKYVEALPGNFEVLKL